MRLHGLQPPACRPDPHRRHGPRECESEPEVESTSGSWVGAEILWPQAPASSTSGSACVLDSSWPVASLRCLGGIGAPRPGLRPSAPQGPRGRSTQYDCTVHVVL